MLLFKGTKVCQRSTLNNRTLFKKSHLETLYSRILFPGTMATRSEDYYKEDDQDSYNYKKTIIEDGENEDCGEDEENEDSEEEDHSEDEENR